jgi:hypothetical protein
METEKMFELASRSKLRFAYRGLISTEDLWDLKLEALDEIYRLTNAELKEMSEDSLLEEKQIGAEVLELQVAIVKHVFEVKVAEIEAKKDAVERKAKKERILEIIAKKQDDDLEGKSLDELKALAESM